MHKILSKIENERNFQHLQKKITLILTTPEKHCTLSNIQAKKGDDVEHNHLSNDQQNLTLVETSDPSIIEIPPLWEDYRKPLKP